MNYKNWLKFMRKNPHRDLDGRFTAYDIDGKPVGEITYKKGIVVSRKHIKKEKSL
jgi:hypothetical protein